MDDVDTASLGNFHGKEKPAGRDVGGLPGVNVAHFTGRALP